MPEIILATVAGVLGIALGYYLRYIHALSKKASIEISVKEKIVEAEEKAVKIIEKAEAKAELLEKEKKQELKELEEKHKEIPMPMPLRKRCGL